MDYKISNIKFMWGELNFEILGRILTFSLHTYSMNYVVSTPTDKAIYIQEYLYDL